MVPGTRTKTSLQRREPTNGAGRGPGSWSFKAQHHMEPSEAFQSQSAKEIRELSFFHTAQKDSA
jgi:hypothetical protein